MNENLDDQEHRMPRWVKVAAIAAGVVVLLLAVLLIAGGHEPSPGRH